MEKKARYATTKSAPIKNELFKIFKESFSS
jgi:hypothetical protein